ncbi:hypothetical protein HI113_43800 [Corallococcus exiguus]|nr:hypothetical protein [Corallococcus exiguus]
MDLIAGNNEGWEKDVDRSPESVPVIGRHKDRMTVSGFFKPSTLKVGPDARLGDGFDTTQQQRCSRSERDQGPFEGKPLHHALARMRNSKSGNTQDTRTTSYSEEKNVSGRIALA